jgi:cation:H+ antiporter
MLLTVAALLAGVVLLASAADQFVIGAARVALISRISPLVVGVVIIGFGTSCPELLVSAFAAAGGDAEIAVGNIVGSNIANLSLLLGVGALIVPIAVASSTVRREAPITVGAVVLFAVLVQGGLSRPDGVVLFAAMGFALWRVIRGSNEGDPLGPETEELADPSHHSMRREVVRTVIGLIGTIGGAQLLLWGAVDVADRAGLGEGFVGATLVAIGTSLPELVTVVQSARRRETDLIVGNLLGSNLFNALAVGGLVGLIGAPGFDAPSLTTVAAGAAVLVAVAATWAMTTGRQVQRWEGALLIGAYAAIVPFLA